MHPTRTRRKSGRSLTRDACLAALVVFPLSALLLAPITCVGRCIEYVDRPGVCDAQCRTMLGYPPPLRGEAWLLVPLLIVAVYWYVRLQRRARRTG